VASAVAPAPTSRLFIRADIHGCGAKTLAYHCSDSPGSGYDKKFAELNDIGITARVGPMRNTITRLQKAT
jgi:hypothetical protein